MSSVIPFSFNEVELCIVIINEKPWTRAREVCRALEYDVKTSKTANIIKARVSPENITQKYQMSSVHTACTPINWPKDSLRFDTYTNEEGMYELLFSNQQPRAKDFRRHCFNVLFPHVQQQLSDKLQAMEIEDLTNCVQALEFTNEEERQAHQQQILRLNEEHQQSMNEKEQEVNDLIANRHVVELHQKEQQRRSPILHYSMPVQAA